MSRSAVRLPAPIFFDRSVDAGSGATWEHTVGLFSAFVWVTKETGRASGRHGFRRLSRHFAVYRVTRSKAGVSSRFLVSRRASETSALRLARDVAVDSEFWK